MNKIGLKLWSTNSSYINSASELYNKGYFDYIELYSVPDSFNEYITLWKSLQIPYIIHAPHYTSGLNFADSGKLKNNLKLADEARRYADELHSGFIIFHPGVNGEIEETISQLNRLREDRILIENKPHRGLHNELCVGHSPDEIKKIIAECHTGFCLDFGHAVYSANAKNIEPLEYITLFLELNPDMYHLSDGDYSGIHDRHDHLGEGNFPLKQMIQLLEDGRMVSIETVKNYSDNLDDFVADYNFLSKLMGSDK